MIYWWIKCFCVILVFEKFNAISAIDPGTMMANDGFEVEVHKVTTKDGYILSLHRIHRLDNNNPTVQRPVVFFMHGLFSDAKVWILPGREIAMPYQLSDLGYDVWLGNFRGTEASNEHISEHLDSSTYWDFSFHEIAINDLPTMINYITEVTQQKSLKYVGHSQGCTNFLAMLSELPELNDKIQSAHLMAPVAYMSYMSEMIISLVTSMYKVHDIFSDDYPKTVVDISHCLTFFSVLNWQNKGSSLILLKGLLGYNTAHTDLAMWNKLVESGMPSPPLKTLVHYGQIYKSGQFQLYDYGSLNNERYSSPSPPSYILENVKCPVYLYYNRNDYFASVVDVQKLVDILPNIQQIYEIPYEKWEHWDYFVGKNLNEAIYDAFIKNIGEDL